jgi:hypothetical protein
MASGQSSTGLNGHNGRSAERDVPVQVMVPEKVRRQLAIMSAERGEEHSTCSSVFLPVYFDRSDPCH